MNAKGVPKVVLGYPFAGSVHGIFARCLWELAQYESSRDAIDLEIVPSEGPYIHHNRNQLCRHALKTGADWLLQLDVDMEFPKEIIERFIAHDKDIVAGLYHRFVDGNFVSPLLFQRHPVHQKFIAVGKTGDGLIEIDGAGTGAMMIRRKVLETIRQNHRGASPWFFFESLDDDTELTDDLSFCNRARAEGFQIHGDCDIPISHWKRIKLTN